MKITLWIVASVLALFFLASGASKVFQSREKVLAGGYTWAEDFSPSQIKLIGLVEMLGALGLVLPAALGIQKWLTPLAAAGLALMMIGAVVIHIRRGETKVLGLPLALVVFAATLAALRFGPYTL